MTPIIDAEQQAELERSIQSQFVGAMLAVATAIGFLLVMLAVLGAMVGVGHCDDGGRSATSEAVSGVQGSSPAVGQAPAQQPAAGSPAAEVTTGSQTVTPAPPCSFNLSLWTPAEHSTQTHQWLQPAARAEGICNLVAGFRAWGRSDLYALPGKAAPTDGTLTNVGAGEVWAGVSRPVAGPFSLAAFTGLHGAVSDGGVLLGGVSPSFCGGARIDYGADYSVVGVCSAYKPAGNGVAVVGTVVLPVKGVVGIAANFAWIPKTGDRIIAVGPTASWGK